MAGVYGGGQHIVMCAGFANVAYFSKWYKKAFMGIAGFSFLQAYAVWNLSVEKLKTNSRGGEINQKGLLKRQFYTVAAEELMSYVNEDVTSVIFSDMSGILRYHQPRSIPKDFDEKCPHFIMCSMEESFKIKVVGSMKTKGKRKWARRRAHIDYCSNSSIQIMVHTCAPDGTKVGMMSNFLGMSLFEIAHIPESQKNFTCIHSKGKL